MAKAPGQKTESKLCEADREMLRFNRSLTPTERVEKAVKAARVMLEIRGLARRRA